MKRKCLGILIILFAFGFSPRVDAKSHESIMGFCADSYRLLSRKLRQDSNPIVKLQHSVLRTGIADNIKEGSPLAGRFGGSRRVYTKKDPKKPWERVFEVQGFNDILLEPDFVVHVLGAEAAQKLGFELTASRVVIPDAIELRGAIESFNRQFPVGDSRRLSLSFFETGGTPLSGAEYKRRLLDGGELPMALSGRLHFHDFTAHLAAAFMPKKIVEEFRKRVKLFSDFDEFIKDRDPYLRRLVSDGLERRTDALIDVGTNNGHNAIVEMAKSSKLTRIEMYQMSSDVRNVTAFNDVSKALSDVVKTGDLSPMQMEAYERLVKDYMAKKLAQDSSLGEPPFGIKLQSSKETSGGTRREDHAQVSEQVSEMIRERLAELRKSFQEWNPSRD